MQQEGPGEARTDQREERKRHRDEERMLGRDARPRGDVGDRHRSLLPVCRPGSSSTRSVEHGGTRLQPGRRAALVQRAGSRGRAGPVAGGQDREEPWALPGDPSSRATGQSTSKVSRLSVACNCRRHRCWSVVVGLFLSHSGHRRNGPTRKSRRDSLAPLRYTLDPCACRPASSRVRTRSSVPRPAGQTRRSGRHRRGDYGRPRRANSSRSSTRSRMAFDTRRCGSSPRSQSA